MLSDDAVGVTSRVNVLELPSGDLMLVLILGGNWVVGVEKTVCRVGVSELEEASKISELELGSAEGSVEVVICSELVIGWLVSWELTIGWLVTWELLIGWLSSWKLVIGWLVCGKLELIIGWLVTWELVIGWLETWELVIGRPSVVLDGISEGSTALDVSIGTTSEIQSLAIILLLLCFVFHFITWKRKCNLISFSQKFLTRCPFTSKLRVTAGVWTVHRNK